MANLIVTNLNDSGAGSLRDAITQANASVGVADTIVFAVGLAGGTLTLTSGELALTDDVTIDGDVNGDNKADITISGNNASRIFNQSGSNTDVDLLSLKLTAGNSGSGGAIFSYNSGTLDILDTSVTGNTATQGGGLYAFQTTVSLRNSLVSANTASINSVETGAGGIYFAGDTLTLINTTVQGNSTNGNGGGLNAYNATLNITNSTITDNQADANGSVATFGGGLTLRGPTTATITNSVIADNTSGGATERDVVGTVTTATNSVFGTAVTITNNTSSLTNVADVGLGALSNNGGTTQTRGILNGSVLINAGSNTGAAGISTDANGNARISGGTVDVGATEMSILTVTNLNDSGAGSLRAALTLASNTIGSDLIVFSDGLSGTIQTASTLKLFGNISINGDTNGDGDPDIIIGSDGTSHLGLDVYFGTVALTSLGIAGFSTQSGASAIQNSGALSLVYSVISNNTVTGGGTQQGRSAETILNSGTLSITQTVFANNSQRGETGLAVGYTVGSGLPGNTGGSASTILNTGTLTVAATSFSNVASVGGNGSAGGDANGNGGNGGTGGTAVGGILNFGQLSGQYMKMIGSNSITAGQGGAGGSSTYGGASGNNGAAGVTSLNYLNQGAGSGQAFINPPTSFGDQLANSLNGNPTFVTYGLAGNDVLGDGSGGVRFYGGSGHDALSASADFSTRCKGGMGNDVLSMLSLKSVGGSTSLWDGGLGIDTLDASRNASVFNGSFNIEGLTANLLTGANNVFATISGIENLIGTSVAGDTLTGSTANNVIQGLGGSDILDGGDGNDTLDYSEKTGNVALTLNGSTAVFQQLNGVNEDTVSNFENIFGGSGADVLNGDGLANMLSGGAGVDQLSGFAGDDTLEGGAGGDTLDAGTNTSAGDTLSYKGSALGVSINLLTGLAQAGDAQGDTFSGFENVTGSAFGDQLVGDNGANVLTGGAGNDLFVGGLGADTMIGGADLDVVDYSNFATGVSVNLTTGTGPGGDLISEIENIIGSAFGDVLDGNNGANTMRGGAGNDFMVAGNGADLLIGGADNDEVSYATATTGVLVNLSIGTGANGGVLQEIENIRGSNFGDVLQGDNGANTIRGLDGNDFIIAGNGADLLIGGNDNDTVSYETATAGIFANLTTGIGANGGVLQEIENLTGSNFGDVLIGSTLGNTLKGGGGNDYLVGNAGSDALYGGADNDTFRFETTTFGNDVIVDFQDNGDKLSFAAAVATNFNQFTILNNNTSNVTVQIAGQSIVVQGVANISLTASDFLFV